MWVLDDIDHWNRKFTLPERVGDPKKDAAALAEVSPVAKPPASATRCCWPWARKTCACRPSMAAVCVTP